MIGLSSAVHRLQRSASSVLRVHVLGAEGTGKSTLVSALAARLQDHQVAIYCVPEALRDWVVQQGRTPTANEQAAIAEAQERAIAEAHLSAAQTREGCGIVLADTSPLMTAAYSAHYFDDHSLWEAAASFESGADVRLLMGLDLPWQADPGQRDGPEHQQAVDELIRVELQRRGWSYTVIYGQGSAREQAAWRVIQARLRARLSPHLEADRATTRRQWRPACECCSDPDCEFALFTGLSDSSRPAY